MYRRPSYSLHLAHLKRYASLILTTSLADIIPLCVSYVPFRHPLLIDTWSVGFQRPKDPFAFVDNPDNRPLRFHLAIHGHSRGRWLVFTPDDYLRLTTSCPLTLEMNFLIAWE